ncbi:STN domain-containing protein, partial [Pseudoalteromonas marina]|uniref:STN domain-containing protein n=1 Tax=Pseudoalteromonas marina TaxID=267375 RepID=UPI0035C78E16
MHLPLCLPIYVLVFSLFTTEVKASPVNDKAVFNIPRQRADLSLINFAEQADITLLFPLDKIQQLQTNTIAGEYSIINALQILLDGTGLRPQVSEDGQISILIDPSFERTDNMA